MNFINSVFLMFIVIVSTTEAQGPQKDINIAIFGICLKSHLRSVVSIAQELALTASNKVTLIINSECEDFLMSQNCNFNIDFIHSSIDNFNESLSWNNVGWYLSEYESNILDIYMPKWNDSNAIPDIVVSGISCLAARDLSEKYNLKSVIIITNLFFFPTNEYEILEPAYLPFITPKKIFQSSDNALIRALVYLPKRIIRMMILHVSATESNSIRLKFGLPSISSSNLKSFYISEAFFGYQDALFLPLVIELVGFLEADSTNDPMDIELKYWINNSKGIIYISTGSIFWLTDNQQETLNNIFSLLEYDFLVSSKVLKSDLKNVKIVKWLNQLEIFKSNKILAFISHGGYASVMESIQNLIPIICVPHDSDQFINCNFIEQKGIGKAILQDDFDTGNVKNSLIEVISEDKYKIGVKRMKSIMKTYKGKKSTAEIITGLAVTGFDHLIPRWKYLPWYQKNELDIFIFYFFIVWLAYFSIKKYRAIKNNLKQD